MVDMAVRCRLRSGSPGFKIKVKLGTHSSMARTSPPVGFLLLAVCPPYVPVHLRQRKSQSKVRWTVGQRSVWEEWVAEDKALDPWDYLIEHWMSHAECNRIMGKYTSM